MQKGMCVSHRHITQGCLTVLQHEVVHGLQEEGLWYWDFEGNKMFYDVEEQVRFRVKNVKFQKPPSVQELRSKGGEDDLSGTAAKPIAIMQVRFGKQSLNPWAAPMTTVSRRALTN